MPNARPVDAGIWITSVTLDDYDVRGVLLVGKTGAVVWDTLSHPRDMAPWLPLIADRELTIVYSHADWDHIWGTAGLPSARARIIAHALATDRFQTDVPATLAGMRAAQPGKWDDVVLIPPTENFDRELRIDLGATQLTLHHLPGHTLDCIVGFVPEHGVLLAGDTAETPCPVVPPDSPLTAWIAALRQWADDERVVTVIPAHGAIGGREILRQNAAYLEGILTGRPIQPDGTMTEFYRKTHESNVRWGRL